MNRPASSQHNLFLLKYDKIEKMKRFDVYNIFTHFVLYE